MAVEESSAYATAVSDFTKKRPYQNVIKLQLRLGREDMDTFLGLEQQMQDSIKNLTNNDCAGFCLKQTNVHFSICGFQSLFEYK